MHEDKRGLVSAVLEGTDRAGALSTSELVALIRGEGAASAPDDDEPGPATALAPTPAPAPPSAPVWDAASIRDLRARLGLSQVQLAKRLGVTQGSVSRWERGAGRVPATIGAALTRLAAEAVT